MGKSNSIFRSIASLICIFFIIIKKMEKIPIEDNEIIDEDFSQDSRIVLIITS